MFAWTLLLLLLSAWGTCSEIHDPQEVHLKNVRQLTFGGRNLRPSVSTDGKYLLFTSHLLPDATIQAFLCRQLYVLDLEQPDAPRQHVSSLYGTFESAAFFPHEHRLVTASDYLTIRESRHEVLSMWQKCFLNHGNLGELQSNLEGHNYDLLVTDLNHARPIDLTATRDYSNVEVAVSPKGDLVAFVRVDGRGKRSLWTVRVNGGNETKLVGEMQFVSSPVFSPDGWEIVFHGVDGPHEDVPGSLHLNFDQMDLFSVHSRGGPVRRLTFNETSAFHPSFYLTANHKLLFAGNRTEIAGNGTTAGSSLFFWNRKDKTVQRLTHLGNDIHPVLSADARRLFWSSTRNSTRLGEWNLFVTDFLEFPVEKRGVFSDIMRIFDV